MTAPGVPELTVLTLTLNEAGALGEFLAQLDPAIRPIEPNYEVLIVDGGSTDGTLEIARRAGVRVVTQSRPGYGNAYREGLALSRGKYIFALDADSSHPKSLFGTFWAERERHSVVMGSRYLPGAGDTRPPGRRILSRFLNWCYRTALRSPMTDISGGFRLYEAAAARAAAAESVAPYYDAVAEIIVLIAARGGRVLEIPYRYVPREQGESKARIFKFGVSYFKTLYNLWRNAPSQRP